MNYPVWDVTFGAGLLIAIVSILHVFVSHFAVGGGLFLVLTERKALRQNDTGVLSWLRTHTRFFVLVTVVFGAISGVGIWFTIGLIHPSATSALIHAYVWGWAIEWVFFFVEITAALLYLYGWDKLAPRLHLWYGWIYFLAAFASLVIINGIITFMLTPGKWVRTHEFWTGFFNPTYFPSLAVRTAIALALAGIYALVTASRLGDLSLKARLVKWSVTWILPPLAVMPALVWWYIRCIPPELWNSARGAMPTASNAALATGAFAIVTFVLVLLTLIGPARLRIAYSLTIMLSALGTMGAFEFVREAVRKPFIIANYLYDNSLYVTPSAADGGFSVEAIGQAGVLNTARWVQHLAPANGADAGAGREIFRVECQSCHTADAYRGVRRLLAARQWDAAERDAMLASLDLMHNGVMPPFAGTDAERAALSAYLATLYQAGAPPSDGRHLFEQNCAVCHALGPGDSAIATIRALDSQTASETLASLPAVFPRMPDLKLSEQQRTTLVQWIKAQFPSGGTPLQHTASAYGAERR
jgi:mono/diheme cytochrome c family protein